MGYQGRGSAWQGGSGVQNGDRAPRDCPVQLWPSQQAGSEIESWLAAEIREVVLTGRGEHGPPRGRLHLS